MYSTSQELMIKLFTLTTCPLYNTVSQLAEIEKRNSVWITPNLTVSLPRVPYGIKYYYMLIIGTDLSFESVKS